MISASINMLLGLDRVILIIKSFYVKADSLLLSHRDLLCFANVLDTVGCLQGPDVCFSAKVLAKILMLLLVTLLETCNEVGHVKLPRFCTTKGNMTSFALSVGVLIWDILEVGQ